MNDTPTLDSAPAGERRPTRSPFAPARRRDATVGLLSDLHVARQGVGEPARVTDGVSPAAPNRRDAFFRRLLAVADLGAAAGGLAAISTLWRGDFPPESLVVLPLIVLYAKAVGRYDHDDLVLRKSTLDEVPRLLSLAAAFALSWSLITFLIGSRAGSGEAIILWAVTGLLLVVLRSAARAAAQRSAPRERVLIVGGAVARDGLAKCIAADPGARADVVAFLPLEDERRAEVGWTGPSRRQRSLSFDDLASTVSEQDIDRVLLIPTSADNDLMVDAVRQVLALGVKVSIVPRLFEVIGSAVEFDSVGGRTVLGVRAAGLTRSSRAVKRVMDLVGALIGVVVLAPLWLIVAASIKLDTPGPVF